MAKDKNELSKALHFDGEEYSKWDAWSFKMVAYAAKKGHEEAFTTD